MRVVVILSVLALWVAALASPVQAAPVRPVRPVPGTVTGRVRPAAALAGGRLAFLVDGAPARPKILRDTFTLKDLPSGIHELSLVDVPGGSGAHLIVNVRPA